MASPKKSIGELLRDAPLDIQRCIFDFLPLFSTAALSMQCSALRKAAAIAKVGTEALSRGPEPSRRAFLRLLEVDRPNMRACYTCVRLHPIPEVDHPRTYDEAHSILSRACVRSEGRIDFVPGEFTVAFHHLQEIMKRNQWGEPYGLPLDSLSVRIRGQIPIAELKPLAHKILGLLSRPTPARNIMANFQTDAVINNGELFMKLEYSFADPSGDQLKQSDILFITTNAASFQLCPHMNFMSASDDWPTEWEDIVDKCFNKLEVKLVDSKISDQEPRYMTRLMLCEYCYTEIRCTLTKSEFKVGVWKSLGTGHDPEAESWRRQVHAHDKAPDGAAWDWDPLPAGHWVPGIVRAAYEGIKLPWQYIEDFGEQEYDWLPAMSKDELKTLRKLGIDSRDFDPEYDAWY